VEESKERSEEVENRRSSCSQGRDRAEAALVEGMDEELSEEGSEQTKDKGPVRASHGEGKKGRGHRRDASDVKEGHGERCTPKKAREEGGETCKQVGRRLGW
jgi:hypothetical protein